VKKIAEYVIYSNVYVAFPIGMLTLFSYQLIDMQLNAYFVFVVSSTLFLYPLHRLYGAFHNSTPTRSQQIALHYRHLTLSIMGLAASTSIFSVFQLSLLQLITLIPLGIISIAYTLPLLKWKGKWIKLREIPVLKVLFIALVVTAICFFLPAMWSPTTPSFYLPVALAYFLFLCSITIPFDIRDVAIDQQFDLRTFPTIFGVTGASILAAALLIVSALVMSATLPLSSFLYSWIITSGFTLYQLSLHLQTRSHMYFAIAFEGALVQLPLWNWLLTFL
jgi:4-hydroxybenzoate polyprenyltransferase